MQAKMINEELKLIQHLLETTILKMEDILSPKAKNMLWRLFFPAGQFIQEKSLAREASHLLLKIDMHLRDMNEVLEERNHPLNSQISEFLDLDFVTMSKMLIELPERAQYMISQINNMKKIVESNIQETVN